jgi:hypothetical protein
MRASDRADNGLATGCQVDFLKMQRQEKRLSMLRVKDDAVFRIFEVQQASPHRWASGIA